MSWCSRRLFHDWWDVDADLFSDNTDTPVRSSTLIMIKILLASFYCLDDTAFYISVLDEDKELFWTRQADLTSWDGSQETKSLSDTIGVVDYVIYDGFYDNFQCWYCPK